MFSSRFTSSLFSRHEAAVCQSTQRIFRRTYANSKSKRHVRPQAGRNAKWITDQKHAANRHKMAMNLFVRDQKNIIRRAREQQREDWELGQLKPWREATVTEMETKDMGNGLDDGSAAKDVHALFYGPRSTYGTMSHKHRDQYPKIPEHQRITDWFFRVGDRVCLVEGHPNEVGKIGTIESIDKETERVKVQGVNMVDIRLPQHILRRDQQIWETTEMPVNFRKLRLVYPLPDPKDPTRYRDCIINHLEKRNERKDPFRSFDEDQQTTFDRYLMPQNIQIPWPYEPESVEAPPDSKYDSRMKDVDADTFTPALTDYVIPPEVSGELHIKARDDAAVDVKEERRALRKARDMLKVRGAGVPSPRREEPVESVLRRSGREKLLKYPTRQA